MSSRVDNGKVDVPIISKFIVTNQFSNQFYATPVLPDATNHWIATKAMASSATFSSSLIDGVFSRTDLRQISAKGFVVEGACGRNN